ncbi:hypothetical protein D3C71_1817620 [compost metagenome]
MFITNQRSPFARVSRVGQLIPQNDCVSICLNTGKGSAFGAKPINKSRKSAIYQFINVFGVIVQVTGIDRRNRITSIVETHGVGHS